MCLNSCKYMAFSFFLTTSVMGCSMNELPMKAPSASGFIDIPAGATADSVLSCAESTVQRLEREDDRWDKRVTRKDVRAGVLETGNFEEENESGFRVKVSFEPEKNRADIVLKGAGAYFVDLGTDSAIMEFEKTMLECISRRSQVER